MSEGPPTAVRIAGWSLEELMRSGDLLGAGPIGALERRLAALYKRKHALCVSSATQGLLALAGALEIFDGEVVLPAYTWGGTAAPFVWTGAELVLADVEPATMTIDPEAVRRRITKETRAIVAVDIFGYPADSRALRKLADDNGVWYLHDGAQSFGAGREGRPAGAAAHAGVVSFSPGKALAAGEGGAIFTDDTKLYEKVVALTQHPLRHRRELGLAAGNEVALNGRIHPVAAAWAIKRLPAALEEICEWRQTCLQVSELLEQSGMCEPLRLAERRMVPSFNLLAIRLTPGRQPQEVEEELAAAGHGVWSCDPSTVRILSQQPLFREVLVARWRGRCPVAAQEGARRFILRRRELIDVARPRAHRGGPPKHARHSTCSRLSERAD
jgi:dTDP-4-amino-4,6-dideoxygalactose transaminase